MRIGYSWPLAHRRRMWISMGPAGWLTLGPFIAIGYLILFAIWLLVWAAIGIALAVQALIRTVRK